MHVRGACMVEGVGMCADGMHGGGVCISGNMCSRGVCMAGGMHV